VFSWKALQTSSEVMSKAKAKETTEYETIGGNNSDIIEQKHPPAPARTELIRR